ncbi:hypothetical protein KSP40_PGU001975 [Platanthera guangdongensis]|uniref:SOSEKI DIX-like domain-containing protein n=1 Tax=Platanthera guangdongensis TaxID=2320717 RepID=A0ABR2LW66_9ASPA
MNPSKGRNAETRRANVIYFLNRNGIIEQPHLIRVHHFCHSGVHLRDVKRWMSELRGNEMPESFSWSFQRRYNDGLLWQDLTDDDLITPISNYEYVLLGSLHSNTPYTSAAAAVATSSSVCIPFSGAEVNRPSANEEVGVVDGVLSALQPPNEEQFPKEKVENAMKSPAGNSGCRSCSWRASHLFCNFITCRVAETEDYAVLNTSRRIIAAGGDSGRRRRKGLRSSNWASRRGVDGGGVHRSPMLLQSPDESYNLK